MLNNEFYLKIHDIKGVKWFEFLNDEGKQYLLTSVVCKGKKMLICFDNFNEESFVISPISYNTDDLINMTNIEYDLMYSLYNSNILKLSNFNQSNDNLVEEAFDEKYIDEETFYVLSKGLDYFYFYNLVLV